MFCPVFRKSAAVARRIQVVFSQPFTRICFRDYVVACAFVGFRIAPANTITRIPAWHTVQSRQILTAIGNMGWNYDARSLDRQNAMERHGFRYCGAPSRLRPEEGLTGCFRSLPFLIGPPVIRIRSKAFRISVGSTSNRHKTASSQLRLLAPLPGEHKRVQLLAGSLGELAVAKSIRKRLGLARVADGDSCHRLIPNRNSKNLPRLLR